MINKLIIFLIIFCKNNVFSKNKCNCCNNNKKNKQNENIIDDKIIIKNENENKKIINKNKKNEIFNEEKKSKKLIINNISNSKIGLKNITNTCYINAAIQLLIHDKLFLNNFFNLYFLNKKNKENIVSNNFYKLLLNINKEIKNNEKLENNNKKKNIIIPNFKFKYSIAKKNKKIKNFKIYKQNDSFSFFKLLLMNLKYELNNNCKNDTISYQKNNKNSLKLDENFYNIIEFSLSNNNNNNSIKSFINKYNSIIKNTINNNKNIIIRLKRGDKDKNNKLIKLTKKIYIDDYIFINNKKYYLKSIVIHIGYKSGSGHFINVTKINNEWYYFSDTEYKYCNVENINNFNFMNNIKNNVQNNSYYILYSLNP